VVVAGAGAAAAREALHVAGQSMPAAPEALGLVPARLGGRAALVACGSDVRGLVYAVLELADRVTHAGDALAALDTGRPVVEQPANPIRSIARLFTSEVEDKPWFYDRAFWQRYLTMLATHRYNRFSLTLGLGYNFPRRVTDVYFYFAYPFLVNVPGYAVRAVPLADDERERNLDTLRFIGEEVKRRGLHFQLALWTHAYEWVDSPQANYVIQGLTPDTHARYCRDALRTLLEACPTIDGLTFRIHGESGIPEGSWDFWRTLFDGAVQWWRQSGKPVEIDMHAKGMDQETLDVALATGLPVVVSPKYWAEHMGLPYHQASIRELERAPAGEDREAARAAGAAQPGSRQPAPAGENRGHMRVSGGTRRFTRYGYADLLPEDRQWGVLYRIWPGTQRLLLWGDPVYAAGYGRYAHFAGCQGVEWCEPLSFKGRMGSGRPGGRDGYADDSLRADGGDWAKFHYTYRVWGRLIYNPEADAEGWRRYTRREFSEGAPAAEAALANASRILLLVTTAYHPSASNNRYWPEVYTNMPIVSRDGETRPHPYGDTPSPKRFGTVSSLDPVLFSSVEEFADEVVKGERSGRYSPLDVATALERFARAATEHLARAEQQGADRGAPSFRRWAVDVAIQAALGHFFAGKLRAGVHYALWERTGNPAFLKDAVQRYRGARDAWTQAADAAKVYVADLTFGRDPHLRGHWSDRLAAIEQDLADMEEVLRHAVTQDRSDRSLTMASADVGGAGRGDPSAGLRAGGAGAERPHHGEVGPLEPERPSVRVAHTPADGFRRGEPVPVELALEDVETGDEPVRVLLQYRHLNQAERYVAAEMERDGHRYRATIPAAYSDSRYALQYFFTLRDARGRAWLWPGFDETFSNQPYFVLRQRSS
jgi:hypothetical protein